MGIAVRFARLRGEKFLVDRMTLNQVRGPFEARWIAGLPSCQNIVYLTVIAPTLDYGIESNSW